MKHILLFLLFLPLICLAQESTNKAEVIKKSGISLYGYLIGHDSGLDGINTQLSELGVGEAPSYLGGLTAGIQKRNGQSNFSSNLEAFIVGTCSHQNADNDPLLSLEGYGVKLKESYHLPIYKGYALNPSIGIGFQHVNLNIDNMDEQSPVSESSSMSIVGSSNSFFVDYGLGFSKSLAACSSDPLMHIDLNINYRTSLSEASHDITRLGWSAKDMTGSVLEMGVRFDLN